MSIQLITFDLDDTLWDVTPVMQDAEAALRNWLTLHAPRLGAVPVGSECGFMIAGEGHTIYVSGDTDIMADLEGRESVGRKGQVVQDGDRNIFTPQEFL